MFTLKRLTDLRTSKCCLLSAAQEDENNDMDAILEDGIGIDKSGGIYVQFVDDTDDIDKLVKVD